MPDLVRVVSPDTEAELTAVVEMLEAREVPCFVGDARQGWVSSGVHGCVRKRQVVMVPATRVAEAAALIGDLMSSQAAREGGAREHGSSRLCALLRFIWFGGHRPVARNLK
jgi:hypothetical protein